MKNIYIILAFLTCMLPVTSLYSQITFGGNSFPGGTNFVGWDNSASVTLDIKNNSVSPTQPIDFFINNTKFLQVLTSGDLNTVVGTNGYMINNNYVLRHNGIPSSIYVGVGSGNTNTNTSNNTFVGYNTGNATSYSSSSASGSNNTFVGYSAGTATTTGEKNTFVGVDAGINNTTGISNIFIGYTSGNNNTSGSWNTIVGHVAGFENTTARSNCYFGKWVGNSNRTGINNSFFGSHAGQFAGDQGRTPNDSNSFFGYYAGYNFNTGTNNVFIGSRAQSNLQNYLHDWNNVSNAIAIGANTIVPFSNQMILGDNNVKVGIGLSGDDNTTLGPGPQNKLEINADPAFSFSGADKSGLRFRQLTMNSTHYIAPWGKVLTVDGHGDVVLTIGGGIGFGTCDIPTDLFDFSLLRMNKKNAYFFGQEFTGLPYSMLAAVGIGYECGTLPGKLSVNQEFIDDNVDEPTIAGYFRNGDLTTSSGDVFPKRGIFSICDGISLATDRDETWNFGGDFVASNSRGLNIAVRGITNSHSPEYFGRVSMGGWFEGNGSSQYNYGVYTTTDSRGSINYGLYALASTGTCSNGGPCYDAAAYFAGDTYIEGTDYHYSDVALKDNIQPLQNAIAIINLLNPKTYTFRNTQFPNMNLPHGQQSGLIAQDVKNVVPELVSSMKVPPHMDSLGVWDTTGTGSEYLALNYIGIIPYLIAGMKEQQQNIDSLNSLIIQIQSQVENCCGSGVGFKLGNPKGENENSSTHRVELSDITTIILNQNTPNPFSEETFINYTVPKEVSKAIIMIYDNSGQVLKTVTISERGEGSLHVYAEKLSSGIYSYSLIADGKTIDTKQMVCQK